MDPNSPGSPGYYGARQGHTRDDSYGQLLPRTRPPALRPAPPTASSPRHARRSTSGRVLSNSYAEKHRAQFSVSGSSRAPSYGSKPRSARDTEDKVTKRKGRRRRTTLDHNLYQDAGRARSGAYAADLEKAAFSSSGDSKETRQRGLSGRHKATRKKRRRLCKHSFTKFARDSD